MLRLIPSRDEETISNNSLQWNICSNYSSTVKLEKLFGYFYFLPSCTILRAHTELVKENPKLPQSLF